VGGSISEFVCDNNSIKFVYVGTSVKMKIETLNMKSHIAYNQNLFFLIENVKSKN